MFKFTDILGTLMQSGLSQTGTNRMQHALGAGDRASDGFLSSLLGGGGGGGITDALTGLLGGGKGSGIGSMLEGVLAGALLGGRGSSVKGALGGGAMAMLGAMAFSALKGAGSAPEEVPVGLKVPENAQQEEELEQGAELILKAMINAAKADGKIDSAEVQRILGKLEEAGTDSESRNFVINEMNKPMDLDGIVAAAKGQPQLAAQIYAASLLAIKVDTPFEREYMQRLAGELALSPDITAQLEKAVGM
jgi:uncharacterized membrane protein YebE (DUF533 family)